MRPLSISIKPTSLDVVKHATSLESLANHRPQQSPWHSPVPYLFGGLAAMLGLIAFALLILACSYWRLSASGGDSGERRGDEEKEKRSGEKTKNEVHEEKILVIMAGDDLPRFLATPVVNKCICGGEGKTVISKKEEDDGEKKVEEKENEETLSQ